MDDRMVPGPGGAGRPSLNGPRAGGVRPTGPGGAAEPSGLSAREKEVMSLIADGRTNGEIAARLFLA
jgi:DNA-binding NarL/FixJ family response regulator